MAEFGEAFEAAMEAAAEEESEEALETLKASLEKSGIDANIQGGEIKINGESVDLQKFSDLSSKGDFLEAMKELGFPQSEELEEFANDRKASFDASDKGQQLKALNELKTEPKLDILKDVDNPSEDEMKKLTESNKELKASMDKMTEQLKELKGDAVDEKDPSFRERVSKYFSENKLKLLLGTAMLAFLIWISIDYYDFCKKARNAINGCWSIEDAGKCKISSLTCDNDDLVSADGTFMGTHLADTNFRMCQPCLDVKCMSGDYIPALSSACGCGTGNLDFTGFNFDGTQVRNDFKNSPACENCTSTFVNHNLPSACPNVSGCIAKTEACVGENQLNTDCSKWCDSSLLKVKQGAVIQCSNVSIGQVMSAGITAAAKAGVSDLIPSGLLKDIWKIIRYLILGVIILIVLYYVITGVWGYFSERSKEKRIATDVATAVQGKTKSATK